MSKYDALVLGAGVYGLSIATELANRGVRVAVVARDLPEDVTSTGFASPWAGCNWCTFETKGDTPAAEWDSITFKALGKLAETHPNLCKRIPFFDLWNKDMGMPWYGDLVFNAKVIKGTPTAPLPGDFPHGVAFESYILHAPNYLAHLASGLRARGVPIFRRRLASIDEAFDLPETGRVDIVVNALALGNKTLIGVMDDKMYPAQGQTVLVKAPLVNTCTMATGDTIKTAKDGEGAFAGKPPRLPAGRDGYAHIVASDIGNIALGSADTASSVEDGYGVRALCNAIAMVAEDDDASDASSDASCSTYDSSESCSTCSACSCSECASTSSYTSSSSSCSCSECAEASPSSHPSSNSSSSPSPSANPTSPCSCPSCTVAPANAAGTDDAIAYIIPRPGSEGHVICGGTYNKNNWITQPCMREAERILRACYALDPRLAGPGGKSWRDIEVVSHNVGLRPSRDGGVRLEVEPRVVGARVADLAPRSRTDRQRDVTVVHAYGPGGTGYQSSIGLAQKAADLVVGQMGATPAAPKL